MSKRLRDIDLPFKTLVQSLELQAVSGLSLFHFLYLEFGSLLHREPNNSVEIVVFELSKRPK